MWFIGVEIEQETSAPPPKKSPGSAPELSLQITIMLLPILIFVIQYGRTPFETRKLSAPRRGLCLREVQAYFRFLSVLTAQWVCVGMPISSFIGYYEVAQETELKFVHQNSPTVQLNTSLTLSQARNLKMANCDYTTFLLCPPSPPPPLHLLYSYFRQPLRAVHIHPRPVTRILCGGVLTRPKWTKLPKCIFYCLIRLFKEVAIHEKL